MRRLHIHELDHIVLNVRDVEKSLEFYAGFLGLAPERLDEFKSGAASFPSVRISPGTIIDLFAPALHKQTHAVAEQNVNHFCIVADESIEEIEQYLRDAGVPIKSGPDEVFGARGNGISVYCSDPDGNVVEIRSYVKDRAR